MTATIGYTTVTHGTTDNNDTGVWVSIGPLSVPAGFGTIQKFSVNTFGIAGSGTRNQKIRLACVADNSGQPTGAVLCVCDEVTIADTDTFGADVFRDASSFVNHPGTVEGKLLVHIVLWWGTQTGTGPPQMILEYDQPGGNKGHWGTATYSSTGDPTLSVTATLTNEYQMYATVVESVARKARVVLQAVNRSSVR